MFSYSRYFQSRYIFYTLTLYTVVRALSMPHCTNNVHCTQVMDLFSLPSVTLSKLLSGSKRIYARSRPLYFHGFLIAACRSVDSSSARYMSWTRMPISEPEKSFSMIWHDVPYPMSEWDYWSKYIHDSWSYGQRMNLLSDLLLSLDPFWYPLWPVWPVKR